MEKEAYDVIIIGGGVMGSATAYYLSQHLENKVLLIEQFDFLHRRGSSHGDSRIIRKTYPQEHYTELMVDAYKLWTAVEMESETSVFTRTGGLDMSHRDNIHFKQLIKSAQKYNITTEVLTPAQVNAKFPSVTIPEDNIGVYSPDAGILNATKAVAVFQHLAKTNGCVLKDNTLVTKIYKDNIQGQKPSRSRLPFLSSLLEDKTKQLRTVVVTNQGKEFVCKKCIITTGAWTKKFLQTVNVDLPLRAVQTTVAYWPVENPSIYSSSVFPVFINYNQDSFIYGFPAHEFPNMIKCCAHFGPEVDPDKRDFLPGLEALENEVAPFIRRTFQGVSTTPEKTESCMYTWTPDEDFIIDELPGHPGIFIGCGFSGHGFKLAPIVGKILSRLALSKPNPYPNAKQHFSIERFMQKSKM